MTSTQEETPITPVKPTFENFDDEAVYKATQREASSESCGNFVVEFGKHRAQVARDLKPGHVQWLLNDSNRDQEDYPIRWINIWDTTAQAKAVKLIGEKYDFSDRLINLMVRATSFKKVVEQTAAAEKKALETQMSRKSAASRGRETRAARSSHRAQERDVEQGSGHELRNVAQPPTATNVKEAEDIDLYTILKETVNFSSIDHTDKALCIGAHWLYKRPKTGAVGSEQDGPFMPPKHWIWLAICNDNTVLSFHEHPTIEAAPPGEGDREWEAASLQAMRSNMHSVLLQCSQQGFNEYAISPLAQSSVRGALHKFRPRGANAGTSVGDEGASNLFYYLFEDYAAAGPLKTTRRKLEKLSKIVLASESKAMKHRTSEIIPELHDLSKELRKLKHLFENYKNLIHKVMATTRLDADTNQKFPLTREGTQTSLQISRADLASEDRRVILTKSALERFDRLADRLQWLMLNTIQGHLDEINALSDTYFNLLQQKDSQLTAKLNRSATLLAKLSVLFLPVSLMSGYFGVEIEDLNQHWKGTDYWYAFAVVMSLSFLSLFFFGRLLMFISEELDEMGTRVALKCSYGFSIAKAWVRPPKESTSEAKEVGDQYS